MVVGYHILGEQLEPVSIQFAVVVGESVILIEIDLSRIVILQRLLVARPLCHIIIIHAALDEFFRHIQTLG